MLVGGVGAFNGGAQAVVLGGAGASTAAGLQGKGSFVEELALSAAALGVGAAGEGALGQPLVAQPLTTSETLSRAHKPSIMEFMDKTGVSFEDASDLLYGVVGSNTEVRDWEAIMRANNPVESVKMATAQMYGVGGAVGGVAQTLGEGVSRVAGSGNFELRETRDVETHEVVGVDLLIVDQFGGALRSAGATAQDIFRNSGLFGLDVADLVPLVGMMAFLDDKLGEQMAGAVALGKKEPELDVDDDVDVDVDVDVDELAGVGRDKAQVELEQLRGQLALLGATSVQSYQSYALRIQALELLVGG